MVEFHFKSDPKNKSNVGVVFLKLDKAIIIENISNNCKEQQSV